ncbi:MAG: AI-2E family transporter [Myxococcaceae bacterium]
MVLIEAAKASPDLPEADGRRVDFIWSLGMVALLALGFGVLMTFRGVAVPVLLAVGISYVLNPVVTAVAARGLGRTGGTAAVFGAGVLLLAGFVLYLTPVFRDEAAKLPGFFSRASTQVVPWVEGRFGVSVPDLVRKRTAELGDEAASLFKSAGPMVAKVAGNFAKNTARFLATVLGLLVVPVLTFFFLKDYPLLVERAKGLLPRRAVGLLSRRFAEVDGVLSAFVRGQLTVGAILSVLYATGLSIARIDMAILIGLIAGFGNMVPYLGTAVGVVLALIGLVLSWQGPWQLAVVLLTFVIAQAAEGLVITPRIVGDKVGLPPVAVIIAVLAFGELFGFVGILLAVPSSAILKVVLRVVIERYRKTGLYSGEAKAR